MPSCICGKEIEDWEAICNQCWKILEAYDKKFGTNLRESVVKSFVETGKRAALSLEVLKVLEDRLIPETTKRIEKIKRKMKKICNECEMTEHKDIDECFKCPIHILFNKMLEECLNGK